MFLFKEGRNMKKIFVLSFLSILMFFPKIAQSETADEQLFTIGQCLAMNFNYLSDKKQLPKGNAAYNDKWKKAADAYIDVYQNKYSPCIKAGGTQDACIDKLGKGMQPLFKGFSNGTFHYNKEKRANNWARVEFLMLACTS